MRVPGFLVLSWSVAAAGVTVGSLSWGRQAFDALRERNALAAEVGRLQGEVDRLLADVEVVPAYEPTGEPPTVELRCGAPAAREWLASAIRSGRDRSGCSGSRFRRDGHRLTAIRRNTGLDRIGFWTGDTVHRVNGIDADHPELPELLEAPVETLTVELDRGGHRHVLVILLTGCSASEPPPLAVRVLDRTRRHELVESSCCGRSPLTVTGGATISVREVGYVELVGSPQSRVRVHAGDQVVCEDIDGQARCRVDP